VGSERQAGVPLASGELASVPLAGVPLASGGLAILVAARDEAERIGETLGALRAAFPEAALWVADDASTDGTAEAALAAGAQVVSGGRLRTPHRAASAAARRARGSSGGLGKGGNVTAAAEAALGADPAPDLVLLCDGDLGASAARLAPLVDAVGRGECDLAVAAFSRRVGGGFGVALGFARWAVRRRCGLEAAAPISGQRAMRADVLRDALPFAAGFGMEVGMTIDAVRAGHRVGEYELDLSHRATGRTPAGFLHRGRQLRDFARVYLSRRSAGRPPPSDRGSEPRSVIDSSGASGSRGRRRSS
jgi:glycosyltransferase involved in cell wall biosynthesis